MDDDDDDDDESVPLKYGNSPQNIRGYTDIILTLYVTVCVLSDTLHVCKWTTHAGKFYARYRRESLSRR